MHIFIRLLLIVLLPLGVATAAEPDVNPKAVILDNLPSLSTILPTLADRRVVYVGETHDRYSHHLVQLAILRALHARHPDLAIGLEYFQQPFQAALDDYVAGRIDEATMLRRTQYFTRWRFDYRLYRPILRYAREERIPLVALNVPSELTQKVAQVGFGGLSREEKASLPTIDRSGDFYRERLKAIYAHHPHEGDDSGFEHFLDAQLLWDEGMAARAAAYLQANPGRPMVILAGEGHLAYGIGIPQRLARRAPVASAIVLSDPQEPLSPDLADFVLLPKPAPLPPAGQLGILMGDAKTGVAVAGFTPESSAQAAGIEAGDRIVAIDGKAVSSPADLRLALLDKAPGQSVAVTVIHPQFLTTDAHRQFTFALR